MNVLSSLNIDHCQKKKILQHRYIAKQNPSSADLPLLHVAVGLEACILPANEKKKVKTCDQLKAVRKEKL